MAKQQRVNKFLRDLDFTQNTFEKDPTINRALETRRDNDIVKTPNVGLYHIDYAVKSFLEQRVKPTVEQDGEIIPVPVRYASGEKWASVQRDGFLRDGKGKVQAPIIVFNRNSMNRRDDLKFNKVLDDREMKSVFRRKYNIHNRYDALNMPDPVLYNSWRNSEFYSIELPDYVDISYNMTIWCDYTAQVNEISQQILYFSGQAWGETYKFMVTADSFTFETTNNTGEERMVKATVDFSIKAHIINKDVGKQANQSKFYNPKKVVRFTEAVNDYGELQRPRPDFDELQRDDGQIFPQP
jgi:hypothetical protein